jgi:hypothetical protein
MSDEKTTTDEKADGEKVNLNCPVEAEFAQRVDFHRKTKGFKSRIAYIRSLLEADIAKPDEALVRDAPAAPPAPALSIEELRREFAVLAFLILSSYGRTGSSERAREFIEQQYLTGKLHGEVRAT